MSKGDIVKAKGLLQVGQRVEVSLFSDDEMYTSRIEDLQKEKIIMAMPMDSKRRPIIPQVGDKLYVRLIADQCVYRFFSAYIDKLAEPIPMWIVTVPELAERYQNREFVRIQASIPIMVQITDDSGGLLPVYPTRTVDISGSGLCFIYNKRITIGTRIVIEIENLPDIGIIHVFGEVVRSIEINEKKVFHIGVRFLDLPRPIQNKFVSYIFELQRKNIAKGIEM